MFLSTNGKVLKGHAESDQGSIQPCSLGQPQTIMEEYKQTEQMSQFDTIRKLFVCLVSLDLFEQLPRVQWYALKILILRSFMVLPVKGVSRIRLSVIPQM